MNMTEPFPREYRRYDESTFSAQDRETLRHITDPENWTCPECIDMRAECRPCQPMHLQNGSYQTVLDCSCYHRRGVTQWSRCFDFESLDAAWAAVGVMVNHAKSMGILVRS